jgi:hypothetical protein
VKSWLRGPLYALIWWVLLAVVIGWIWFLFWVFRLLDVQP